MTAEWQGRIVGKNARVGKARDGHLYAREPYVDFRRALAWTFRAARRGKLDGPVSVRLEYDLDPARDLDSAITVTFDALEDSGIIDDDNQIARLLVVRRTHARGEMDTVRIAVEETN